MRCGGRMWNVCGGGGGDVGYVVCGGECDVEENGGVYSVEEGVWGVCGACVCVVDRMWFRCGICGM